VHSGLFRLTDGSNEWEALRRGLPEMPAIRALAVHPLKRETRYLVRVTGATSLIGKKGDGEIGFTVPKPVVPDTTHRARADTTHRAPRTPP